MVQWLLLFAFVIIFIYLFFLVIFISCQSNILNFLYECFCDINNLF